MTKESKVSVNSMLQDVGAFANYIEVFQDRDVDALLAQIKQIKFPFSVISWYGLNGRHFAVLRLSKAVVKKTIGNKNNKKSEVKDVIS